MMNYLALGDSYTIGEQLPSIDSFPYQLVQMLRGNNLQVNSPEIIAKTAWTTTDLLSAIDKYPTQRHYSFCTLLIGVNNQYQKKDISLFTQDVNALCKYAMKKVEDAPNKLIILNIPDWGLTPYNQDRNPEDVSKEIDDYNHILKAKSVELMCHYVDVCTSTRAHAQDESYLTEDKLHPSAKEYKIWAEKILTETLNL